jgi:hypothetical protein
MRPIAPRPLSLPPAAPGRGATPAAQPAATSATSATGATAAGATSPAVSPGAPTTTTSASYGAADPDAPSSPASNPPALDDERVSIAPLLGYASDGLDLGVGVRVGKTIADHLWIGGTGMYHAGTSTAGVVGNVRYESSTSAFFVGGELGYDFELGPVVLRPYGGLGLAGLTASASSSVGPGASQTATKLVIWPGATLLYGVTGSRFFVGGDTRLITIPGGPAFALYAVGGLTL